MQELLKNIQIKVNENIYLKDPESSELGRELLKESIKMIHEMGLEAFTFRKLAAKIGTTESTIYRYFENKHKLLIYLISWYWGWLEYEMVLNTMNIANPKEKLQKTIEAISVPLKNEIVHNHINLRLLHEIVIAESPKAFLTKEVDTENANGLFANYKRVNDRLIKNIEEINPEFRFSKTLASVIMESANQQRFFALHFPNLTNLDREGEELDVFLYDLVLKTINSI